MKSYPFFLLLLLLTGCTQYLFVPVKKLPVTPDKIDIQHRDIYIQSSEGYRLHGWKLMAEQKTAGSILFFHGNGDNVSTQLPNTVWLTKQGYDVYVFDYSGYGISEGWPSLDSTIKDLELMIEYVITQLPDDEKLIILGHSLGASMGIYTVAHSAYKYRIKGLITVAAFSDFHDITQDVLSRNWLTWLFQWPLSFTVDNSYRPLDSIGLVSPVPLLIMHSEADKLIDIYHARRLLEAARQPRQFIRIEGDHNNIFSFPGNRKLLLDYLMTLEPLVGK